MFQTSKHSSSHAEAARRAVLQMIAAKALGDEQLALAFQLAAARYVDAHLAQLRRLS